jgi:hypothetical protein
MTLPTDPFHELARRIPARLPGERLFTMDFYDDYRDLRFPARDVGTGWPAFRPEVAAVVVDWLNALHAADPEGFDSAVWDGHTILVTLTGHPEEGPIAIDPGPDGRYREIGAATGWAWVIDDPAPAPVDPGTPTYDALIAELVRAAGTGQSRDAPPSGVPVVASAGAQAILTLFGRLKALEERHGGWPGADTVSELRTWFAELGVDVEADPTAAARTLRLPAEPHTGVITVRINTAHDEVDTTVDTWAAALVNALGPDSSAVVIDRTGRQLAHHSHPGTDPTQS